MRTSAPMAKESYNLKKKFWQGFERNLAQYV